MGIAEKLVHAGILTLLCRAIAVIIAAFVVRFLYTGYVQRMKVRKLKAQGIPVIRHSFLLGHLPLFFDFRRAHPPDVSFYVLHTWLADNAIKYFPELNGRLPPIVYLDLWPLTYCYALVYDGVANQQFTQVQSVNKHQVVRDFLVYMTQTHDLFSSDGPIWKTWRSRFNPGFSSRNISTMIPELMEEVLVFVDILKQNAGPNGTWGRVFPLERKTTNLTFDIIVRAILDIRLHDQTTEPGAPLKLAMVDQINLMNEMPIMARNGLPFLDKNPQRLKQIAHYNDVMHEILLKPIQERMRESAKPGQKKTAVDLALKYMEEDEAKEGNKPEVEFVDRLIANLKVMMFAGHDTTSATICFMTKCLQDNPDCLAKLRHEHDVVLGEPDKVVEVLTASPHLIYSLPYTLGVIKETLRLWPLASTVRETEPNFFISAKDDPMRYPADGWALWTASPGLHRNPDYWHRPNEFLPERWIVGPEDPLHPVLKDAWTPFSIGPRSCIGMELALTELKLVSVMIARSFDMEEAWDEWDKTQGDKATPDHKINGERLYMTGNSTVHPKDGMPVRVRMRTHVSQA